MAGGLLKNPERWRLFAGAVATALGINVWVSVILLPAVFVGALGSAPMVVASALPLLLLFIGLWLRSDGVLLLGFPSALLVPIAIRSEIVAAHVYGPGRFTLVSISVVAYLLGASFLSSFHEPPPPERTRALSSAAQPVPERWRRRSRMYLSLTVLSAVFPGVLIYAVNYDTAAQEFLARLYAGRIASFTTLLNVAVIGLWLFLYSYAFLGVLRPHRVGDRALAVRLAQLRAEGRRGRPRPIFYAAVAVALGGMLLLLTYEGGS